MDGNIVACKCETCVNAGFDTGLNVNNDTRNPIAHTHSTFILPLGWVP